MWLQVVARGPRELLIVSGDPAGIILSNAMTVIEALAQCRLTAGFLIVDKHGNTAHLPPPVEWILQSECLPKTIKAKQTVETSSWEPVAITKLVEGDFPIEVTATYKEGKQKKVNTPSSLSHHSHGDRHCNY